MVQFNENHKWCGSLGIIEKVKGNCGRYMISVPIFVNERDNVIEYVGRAVLMAEEVKEDD